MISATERVVTLHGVINFRDFGGWRTLDGARVRTGRLFRSGQLNRVRAADLDAIGDLGIERVTDLRQAAERRVRPGAWIGRMPWLAIEIGDSQGVDAEPPHIAAFRASDGSTTAMRRLLADTYRSIPFQPDYISVFGRYFAALADGSGAMLMHCAAGKDRTGILAWLTHRLLSVHPDDAMEDYLLSNAAASVSTRLPLVRREMETTFGLAIDDGALKVLLQVEPDYIHQSEAAIIHRSGSISAYFANVLGIGPDVIGQIRERLLS